MELLVLFLRARSFRPMRGRSRWRGPDAPPTSNSMITPVEVASWIYRLFGARTKLWTIFCE
eukprot:4916289-Pyramimonas_sp.AAC.1